MTPTRDTYLEALARFMRQRPCLEFGNYGDVKAYRSESREITRTLQDARILLRAVFWRTSIDVDALKAATRAYSGRLQFVECRDGSVGVDYCAGQCYPTEYRKAVCAVLASALWAHARDNMPAPLPNKLTMTSGYGTFTRTSEHDNIEGLTPGDWLRRYFRREFGRGIANRWFN